MENLLIVVNASPYGSERCLSALRLALALTQQPCRLQLFLLSDAVVVAQSGQQAQPMALGAMLQELLEQGVAVSACRTCTDARGVSEDRLLAGVRIETMQELAAAMLAADKVLSF